MAARRQPNDNDDDDHHGPQPEINNDDDGAAANRPPSCNSRNWNDNGNVLKHYLQRIEDHVEHTEWPRVTCPTCDHRRHLYCFECCQLLIPPPDWPLALQPPPNETSRSSSGATTALNLPFCLDILLQDRRASSTGVQMATLLQHALALQQEREQQHPDKDNPPRPPPPPPRLRLIDLDEPQPQPKRSREKKNDKEDDDGAAADDDHDDDADNNEAAVRLPDYARERREFGEQALVLFPSHQSVPLSQFHPASQQQQQQQAAAAKRLQRSGDREPNDEKDAATTTTTPRRLRLIVLDCRWNQYKRVLAMLPNDLQQVHLDNPPQESFYWRWHNAGTGCLSSAEAVFWAAWQLQQHDEASNQHHHHQSGNNPNNSVETIGASTSDVSSAAAAASPIIKKEEEYSPLLDLLWIFAVQRALIQKRFRQEKEERTIPHLPFSDQAKEHARELRRRQGQEHKERKTNGT